MQRPNGIHGLLLIGSLVFAGLAPAASAEGLTDLLVSKVGVTKPQAEGGAGSIFKFAKSQMTKDNFKKIKGAVPDMSTYLGAAPAVESAATPGPGDKMGGLAGDAAKMLGGSDALSGVTGKLQAAQALAPAFEKLGMKPAMVTKFVPVVVDYVKSSGGAAMARLLTGALGI